MAAGVVPHLPRRWPTSKLRVCRGIPLRGAAPLAASSSGIEHNLETVMIATPVAPVAEPGELTVELNLQSLRINQLRRLSQIKRLRRELLAEQDRIEQELFGPFWADQRAVDPS